MMNNQFYDQPSTPLMNEKLPGIDKLPKLEANATPSPQAPVSYIDNNNKHVYTYLPPPPSSFNPGIVYNQHMSPPLTPAVSPSSILLDPMNYKRKFSVDVGPFGFGTAIPHPPALQDQDAYRRSSCSAVSMDIIQQQQQQVNDYGFLNNNSNDDSSFSDVKPRRGSRAHLNGPATQHKHVCKYPYCNWSFKRYEHLKRHILVHTGKRPHVCHYPGCGKSFSRSDNFHAHYRTHMKKANMLGTKKSTTKSSNSNAAAAAAAAVAVAAAAAASVTSSMSTPSPQVFDQTQPFDMTSYQDMYARPTHNFEGNNTSYVQHQYFNQEQQHDHHFTTTIEDNSSGNLLDHEIGGTSENHCFYHTSPTSQHNYMTPMQGEPSYGYNYTNDTVTTTTSVSGKSGRKSSDNNEKTHACPVLQCQRRFKRLEHLKRHMRIHTLERPFSCTFPNCQKTFSRSDNLSAHMKTHSRSQYPRRKPKQQQQQQENNMISNMVDMSWHSAGTVGC